MDTDGKKAKTPEYKYSFLYIIRKLNRRRDSISRAMT
jgi:hypothetical protein